MPFPLPRTTHRPPRHQITKATKARRSGEPSCSFRSDIQAPLTRMMEPQHRGAQCADKPPLPAPTVRASVTSRQNGVRPQRRHASSLTAQSPAGCSYRCKVSRHALFAREVRRTRTTPIPVSRSAIGTGDHNTRQSPTSRSVSSPSPGALTGMLMRSSSGIPSNIKVRLSKCFVEVLKDEGQGRAGQGRAGQGEHLLHASYHKAEKRLSHHQRRLFGGNQTVGIQRQPRAVPSRSRSSSSTPCRSCGLHPAGRASFKPGTHLSRSDHRPRPDALTDLSRSRTFPKCRVINRHLQITPSGARATMQS